MQLLELKILTDIFLVKVIYFLNKSFYCKFFFTLPAIKLIAI